MNDKKMEKIRYAVILVCLILVITGCTFGFFMRSTSDDSCIDVTDTVAEIAIDEDAESFDCCCGCCDKGEDDECKCEGCMESEEETAEEYTESSYIYEADEEKIVTPVSDCAVEPVTEEEVEGLVKAIFDCSKFTIRRCESTITDALADEPGFNPDSEARYYYDAVVNEVQNDAGENITDLVSFDMSGVSNAWDFFQRYFNYRDLPTDFMTDDTSHTMDLFINQRVYSYGNTENREFERVIQSMEEEVGPVEITGKDLTYQIKEYEDGVDRITYITVTVTGKDASDSTVIKFVTYCLDYEYGWEE